MNPKIHLAFRFHGNFYHSYRGDTPDELGFGKDIRIIRHILRVLDEANRGGLPVRGTWDFENYFSLETLMPQHCPDIIAALQRRARENGDEMQIMSYNNGLINAHSAREFEESIRRAITNPQGSGLADLFGEHWFNMVRPQEMMFTPIHLRLYKACGVDSLSLYYSALPFNGFSNFVPPLPLIQRYNPLTLGYPGSLGFPGIDETMTLLPCYNVGDLADHLTLRRWIQGMRRAQLALPEPQDLLLLLDQDADDVFWEGFPAPAWLKRRLSTLRGLTGLLEDVRGLDYVEFTTPGCYLQDHPPVGSISFGQDTADGSFDGLSSWTEKWSNHRLFTGLERARLLDLQTRRLLQGQELPGEVQSRLETAFEARLLLLSTTHFGMAAPVMNLARERTARRLAQTAVENAGSALALAAGKPARGSIRLVDYARGETTGLVKYPVRASRALLRLPLRPDAPGVLYLEDASGQPIPCAVVEGELFFTADLQAAEERKFQIQAGPGTAQAQHPVQVTARTLQNQYLRLEFNADGHLIRLKASEREAGTEPVLCSAVTYGGRNYAVKTWQETASISAGVVGIKRLQGKITLPGGFEVMYEREFLLAAGLPYLYLTTRVHYPRTPDAGYDRGKAQRLQQAWDNRWQEVLPCEIRPHLAAPQQVWKHNYCGHISSFELDYGKFSKNRDLASVNNQVTAGWLAVSDGENGLLVAQTADSASNAAFCPLRLKSGQVFLNPFGSYWGKQYHYATADTGLGKLLASLSAADHIQPYAPSYNGRSLEFRLLLAPYEGDCPPEEIQQDAEAFAYPYIQLNDEEYLAAPPHRLWDGSGLGEMISPRTAGR